VVLGTRGFALFNLGLVVVWLVLAFLIGRRYAAMTAEGTGAKAAA
jgi:hypothetical protein